jgi:hypothetical protein
VPLARRGAHPGASPVTDAAWTDGLTLLLAIAGALALLYRFLGGVFRLALGASHETAARGMAEVSARRGDLTAMAERRQAAELARRDRRRQLLLTSVWILWFTIPLLLGSPACRSRSHRCCG